MASPMTAEGISPSQGRSFLRRTQLLPSESLPSLLERLTRLNYYASASVLRRICHERQTAALDEDDLACPRRMDTLVQLAQLTQIPVADLLAASRHRFAATLPLSPPAPENMTGMESGAIPALSRARAQAHFRADTAAQYCPVCLKTGRYHRWAWTPRAAAICLEHGSYLVGSCPGCESPLSIREIVWRHCQTCQADLCTAPVHEVWGDELGLLSQRMIQAWLAGADGPEPPAEYGLPETQPAVLYHLLESLCRLVLACRKEWPRFPSPLDGLAGYFGTSLPGLRRLTPEQSYALHRAAFTGLLDWPQGFFQLLDACSQRLESLRRNWFQPGWDRADFDFLKRAYVQYRVSRQLPIPVAFAHRHKTRDWFVESAGIWTQERTAQALELSVEDLARFYPLGSLKHCVWSSSAARGALFRREEVLGVQRQWKAGWSVADTGSWLGLSETEVIRLAECQRLGLWEGAAKNDPFAWKFSRKSVEEFFQQVAKRLELFHGDPLSLCRLFEMDRYLRSLGIDRALLMQQVADGLLPAYKTRPEIRSLEEVCFVDTEVETWPDRWYALQGLVAERGFAHEKDISPGWVDRWAADGLIAPKLDFGYVRYFERSALEGVIARLNIFET